MQGAKNVRSEAYLMYAAMTNIEGNAAGGYFSTEPKGPLAQLVEQLTLNQ